MFMHSSAKEVRLQALLFDHKELHNKGVDGLIKTYQAFCNEDVRGMCLAHMVDIAQLAQQPDFVFDKSHLYDMGIPEALLLPLAWFLN